MIVSYFHQHNQYMHERSTLAMTPGEALDLALQSLQINMHRIANFKSWTELPDHLEQFSQDIIDMPCIGGHSKTLREVWEKRHHA